MKNKITHNLGLKILSVLVSFFLWLLVVNYDDPVISSTYSGIVVEIVNQEALTDQGKVYEILNNSDTISVTVTGPRSVISSLSKENIHAVADMRDLTLMDTLGIQLSTNKNFSQLDSIRSDRVSVELQIEDRKEVHYPIVVSVNGSPAEGYIVGDISTNQNTVRVSGPESIVSSISRAECVVNVMGRTSDITTSAEIKLYDANNELVEHQNLQMNIGIINISIPILATKEVPINFGYTGIPAEGYFVEEPLQGNVTTIVLAGKQNYLENIDVLEIPEAAINVTDRNQSFTENINIARFLPEGVQFADNNFNGIVSVSVELYRMINREFNISVNNLVILNLPAGLHAEILLDYGDDESVNGTLNVATEGISDAYAGVTGASIRGTIDFAQYLRDTGAPELTEGIHHVPVTFILPENIQIAETVYVDVNVTAQ